MPTDREIRLANFGRDTASTYKRYRDAVDRMVREINGALEDGMSVREIEEALLDRCRNREQMLDVFASLAAKVQMGNLPGEFEDVTVLARSLGGS